MIRKIVESKKLQESSDWSDKKILVRHIEKTAVEDSYEEGEIGRASIILDEIIGEIFNNAGKLMAYMISHWGCDDRNDNWGIDTSQSGIILVTQHEDKNGNIVKSSDKEWELWKEGRIKLYTCDYRIYVEIVQNYTPSGKELIKLTGFQSI